MNGHSDALTRLRDENASLRRAADETARQIAAAREQVEATQQQLQAQISQLEHARGDLSQRTAALQESESRLRLLADASSEGLLICKQGRVVDANKMAARLFGRSIEALPGMTERQLIAWPEPHSDDADAPGNSQAQETQGLRGDGSSFPCEISSRPLVHNGEAARVLSVRDITESVLLRRELERLARTDGLTGVNNRRYFLELAARELQRAQRYRHPLSMLMIDIDHFKRLNDSYGHDIGDRAIMATTDTCVLHLRNVDIFGRLGGEEFAAVLPETGAEGAKHVAERLGHEIAAITLEIHHDDTEPVRFTVSIGVATLAVTRAESLEDLLKRADDALYRAKRAGRDRVAFVAAAKP